MHRCTKGTRFTWIFAKRDTHPKKNFAKRHTWTKKRKKLKCVHAYMYIVGNKGTKVHFYICEIMARCEKGDKQSPYSKNMLCTIADFA